MTNYLAKQSDPASAELFAKFTFQIKLLLWKRWLESTKSKWELLKILLPSGLFMVVIIFLYAAFDFFAAGAIEPILIPVAFWIYIQRIVVQIMFEKSSRLQESMRMMGLSDLAYYTSYFISDGIVVGFIVSLFITLFTVGGLFNGANFGVLLGFLFVFCLSVVPFSFFLCAFFDTAQTSGQATVGILFGIYMVYIVVFTVDTSPTSTAVETLCCFLPPLALQVGAGSFLKSHKGISINTVCWLLVADIFIYSLLAWYFTQAWPSKIGVPKPWYFPLEGAFWCKSTVCETSEDRPLIASMEEGHSAPVKIPHEGVDEKMLGTPSVVVRKLRKTFGEQVSVNDLSFDMYENQIFALLGHNGAGKTTTISMLTGLISPDATGGQNGASVYSHDILTDMAGVREPLGVCLQHDVLFENLSVREHVLFFAQLKGATFISAEDEARDLLKLFHLDEREDHLGHELSGGQRRKLSVAIAVCAGSKFVVLDEPTAGMDPLARRELWDLLISLRKGRTMLLTTHYMDEADVLGDRVGIMSLGQMQCVGTTQFLKNTYGAGYKLIFDKSPGMSKDQLARLTAFVHQSIPEAKYFEEDGAEEQAQYSLPFSTVSKFGPFFTKLDAHFKEFHVTNYGVTITSLEDVFLKVGEDHTVTPSQVSALGIGQRSYRSNMLSQIRGICKRKLSYALHDFITVPLLGLPLFVCTIGVVLYTGEVISDDILVNDLVLSIMYMTAYLGAPGLIAELIVRERNDKLRNVLTVMGCDFRAYWIGTFLADYTIMSMPMAFMWLTWFAGDMCDFYAGMQGLNFFIMMLFTVHLVAFSYLFSFVFGNPKSCISLMPAVVMGLLTTPTIFLLTMSQLLSRGGYEIPPPDLGGTLLWGVMLFSPHGALLAALLATTQDFSMFLSSNPPVGVVIAYQIAQSALFLYIAYRMDAQSVAVLQPKEDPLFDPACLLSLDEDVLAERDRTLNTTVDKDDAPLRIERLRKVFPSKHADRKAVVAAQDVAFKVESGEIFGLLGANGAGKTTTLSMLTRHLTPTSGDAFIAKHSILSAFSQGATRLGVVTQNNSLWDRLSVQGHLKLFARLRGVPEDLVYKVVDATIDQLELTPHRYKVAASLSGGMKRKLCVAIALIGDPEVVLLDEPSAGLDPVSRRNLWSVILRTMSHRAVILTTHSMDEAEALCKRIGIMVQGQLRALGTKQHLKNKFGSGFELVIKLTATKSGSQLTALETFMRGLFPSAVLIAEHGGLLTFRVPWAEMKMGVAFTQLEENKTLLGIDNYSIAQPTLEQVFIRTVNMHTPDALPNAGSTTVIGGGALLSVAGTDLLDCSESTEGAWDNFLAEDVNQYNRFGCTARTVTKIVLLLTVVMFVVTIVAIVDGGLAGAFGFPIFILLCMTCCIRFCSVCKHRDSSYD